MNNIKILLGKQIKKLREEKFFTQEQLAEKVNINSRSLSLIECGINFVTAETLGRIAESLNTTPKELFDFSNEFSNKVTTKQKLLELINENEDKIPTIYNIVKGYLS